MCGVFCSFDACVMPSIAVRTVLSPSDAWHLLYTHDKILTFLVKASEQRCSRLDGDSISFSSPRWTQILSHFPMLLVVDLSNASPLYAGPRGERKFGSSIPSHSDRITRDTL